MMNNQPGREMKTGPIFQGELVCLIPPDPETDAGLFARWMRDSEFVRLMDADPARLMSVEKHKQWLEKDLLEEPRNDELFFLIRTRQEEKTIGLIGRSHCIDSRSRETIGR